MNNIARFGRKVIIMNSLFKILFFGLFVLMAIVFTYFISNQRESPTLTSLINSNDSGQIQINGYKIVNTYPHDQDAYTQGIPQEDRRSRV